MNISTTKNIIRVNIICILLSFIIYTAFRTIIDSFWVFLISYIAIFDIYCFSYLIFQDDSVPRDSIIITTGWGGKAVKYIWTNGTLWGVCFFVSWTPQIAVLLAPILFFVLTSVVMIIISPILYIKHYNEYN